MMVLTAFAVFTCLTAPLFLLLLLLLGRVLLHLGQVPLPPAAIGVVLVVFTCIKKELISI